MTNPSWQKILRLFEENEKTIKATPPHAPAPKAKLCGESAHFALGHLISCQAAWLPLMRAIRDEKTKGSVPINPNPLFTKLGFQNMPWDALVERFVADRAEWRRLLDQVDLSLELQTSRRIWSAQTLTKRMIDHEQNHLQDHFAMKTTPETIEQTGKTKL